MNLKEKEELYNKIISSTNNNSKIYNDTTLSQDFKRKEEMYNNIMKDYNKKTSSTPISTKKSSLKFTNFKESNINKFKSALEKNKKTSVLDKEQAKFTAKALDLSYEDALGLVQKQNEQASKESDDKSFWDKTKITAKSAGSGVLSGFAGIAQAGSTELQNNLKKGENKSFLESAGDVAKSYLGAPIKTATLPFRAAKQGYDILTEKGKTPFEKAIKLGIETPNLAFNSLPFKDQFNMTSQLVGNLNNQADTAVKETTDRILAPQREFQNKLQEEIKQYDEGTQLASNVANAVGYMVPSIATSIAAGPAAGLAVTGVSAKGTGTEEMLQKGADLDTAVKVGNVKGITEVGTEMLTGGVNIFGKGILDDIVEKGIAKKVKNKVGKFLLQQGYDFAGEVGEEVISDIIGTALDKGTVDPNATYSLEDLGETAVTTILTTTVLKALGVPVNKIQKSIINNQENIDMQKNDFSESNIAKEKEQSNISNHLNSEMSQNAISGQIEENTKNSDELVQENNKNQVNMKNKAQNYINKSKSQFINDLVSDLQTSKYSNKEVLNQSVDEIINEINNNGKISKEKADELFENLYSKLTKTDSDYYNQYKDLKEDLRKTKLFVPKNVENDIVDFVDFKKNNRGDLVLTNDNSNINIDTKYKELSETYPELFPIDITNQSEQLKKISEVARDIKKTETNVQAYLDKNIGPEYKMWAKEDFNKILDRFQKNVNLAYRYNADTPQKSNFVIAKDELTEMYKSLPQLRKSYEKVMNSEVLTAKDKVQVDRLLKNEITIDELPNGVNKKGIINVFKAKQPLNIIQESIKENRKNIRSIRLEKAQKVLGDLSKWKDKKIGWLYSRETASRNIYDIAPKEVAQKIDNNYIQPYHQNEADAIRTINKYTEQIKGLKLSTSKKYNSTFSIQEILDGKLQDVVKTKKVSEAELVQIFGEGRITLDQLKKTGVDTNKIINAVETFRKIYDELFDKTNEVLLKNGLEPVQKRANYFPHFTEAEPDGLLSKAAKIAGIYLNGEMLPTDIAGKTQNFNPNKKFVGNFLQRSTDITDFNALKGFDNYIKGVTDVIYHTEDIMNFKALSDSIRNFYNTDEIKNRIQNIEESTELTYEEKNEKIKEIKDQTINKSNLSNFVTWFDNYIKILAGKKSINDRGAEKDLSRKMYKLMTNIESRIGANMVAGNASVSFTNLAPLAQASAEVSVPNLIKGMYGSMLANGKSIVGKRDTSFASESDFITRRRGTENTNTTVLDKITKPLDVITSSIDDVISEGIVRARYIQNLKKGMTQQDSLHEADVYAAGLMADRSKGALPTQFYSTNPLAKMVNMFQVEVNNQYSYYFKDMKRNIQNNTNTKSQMVAKMTHSYAKLLIGSYIMNELISKFRGNATRVLPDPIYIIKELIKGLGNDDKDDDWETIAGTSEEILGNTPFASVPIQLFGTAFGIDTDNIGRVSISGAIPNINNIGSAITSDSSTKYKTEIVKKELEKPLYNLIFPKAGSQFKKTAQGAEAVIKGGSYTTSKDGEKKLQFTVNNKSPKEISKALLFGKWSTSDAQEYDSNPLTKEEQEEMNDLDISFKEYKKYKSDLKSLNNVKSDKNSEGKTINGSANGKKAYQIMNGDYSIKEKEYLIKKLNSEDKTYRVDINDLKKLDNSENVYKYFYGLSSEKQKEFISDIKKYNFNSKKMVECYQKIDDINDTYKTLNEKTKKRGYDEKVEKEKISEINKEKKSKIAESIINTDFNDEQKMCLYSKSYSSDDVKMATTLGIKADSFIKFDSQSFESDHYTNGKTVKNSKLNKIVKYVNDLDGLSVAEKAILIKSKSSGYDKYNQQIVNYIDKQNLSLKEKEKMLENIGFKIKNGRVY